MNNFDLRKYLAEGRLLKEEQMGSYRKFLKVVKSYEDEEILSDFLDSYPKGQDISKSEYDKFTEKHLGLADPEDHRGENWKYIMSEGKLFEEVNTEEEIKAILSKSYPGAYSEDDFEEIINLYNTKYKDYRDSYGNLDGVEQSAFKFNYANNRDIITGMKAGSKSSTSVDFPEMEDEFEGAMSSMSVSKEEYLQDIINASADEIVSDNYFEIKNAVEQGVYSKDEAVKLAKEWAKNKLK